MELCQYKPVDKLDEKLVSKSWKPLLRQLLVCSGLFTTYFVTGLSLGAPTVVIPQLRRTTSFSDEIASWLSSAFIYGTLPWVIILPTISQRIGRKKPVYFAISTSIVSFFILYFGNTIVHFLISQIIQAILMGSNLTVSVIMVTEYTSPKYRGIFLTIKSASVWWGMWASNAIGTFFEWNYIGLFGLICSTFYLTIFIWPESPHWLATKGRFEECIKAHRWLKGVDRYSEDELRKLIDSQKEYLKNSPKNLSLKENVKSFASMFRKKEFYMPVLISILVMAQHHSSGKIVCSIYSIELIKKITESESTAYSGMLILDGVSVAGMYLGSILSKFLPRRFLLIVATAIGILFLYSMSLYLWLVEYCYVTENKIISIFFLAAFSISISCGPMIMSTSITAELIPLRFKSPAVIITTLMHFILMGTAIKVAPLIFKTFSLYGTFSLYATLASLLTFVLYKYLPETKDKTLQEIEEYFRDSTKKEEDKEEAQEIIDSNKK